MNAESAHIEALRALAASPAARGLADDAAVLDFGNDALVLTLDTVVEGVHFLPDDPPGDVAWKLVAVNVSDLAAKGADPVGCLYSHALGEDMWDTAFLAGLAEACAHFAIPLLGGDTVRMPRNAPRSFSLTALGRGPKGRPAPARGDAQPGDRLWVSGTIGDAGLGLAILTGARTAATGCAQVLARRYRRPEPSPANMAASPNFRWPSRSRPRSRQRIITSSRSLSGLKADSLGRRVGSSSSSRKKAQSQTVRCSTFQSQNQSEGDVFLFYG